jgi:hypothetical protein
MSPRDEGLLWRQGSRWWIVVFVPLVVFGPSQLLEFGLRDDYSILREVHEEPGKVLALCASQARLIYGFLLEASFSRVDGVGALAMGRLLAAVLIGLAGAIIARTLIRRFQWGAAEAIALGALVTLLPAPQVISSWATCWPHALAAVLGVSAFALAERARTREGRLWVCLLAALVVMIAGILTYQSNVLLYAVPLVAGWLRAEGRRGWGWLSAHLGLIAVALGSSFALSVLLIPALGFKLSNRVAIDWDILGKLGWFAANPLREALGLYVLRDNVGRTEPWYSIAQLITAAAVASALVSWTAVGATMRRTAGYLAILCVAYAVSFVAVERWASYRTLWPLTGVLLVATCLGAQRCIEWVSIQLDESSSSIRVLYVRFVAAAAVAVVAFSAGWNVRQLIAQPQAQEWARMRDIAGDFDPSVGGRVFVVLPRPAETTAPVRHLDEFGSLSADCDWAAREMFKHAVRAEHQDARNPLARLVWQSGYAAPIGAQLARVVDFRYPARVWTELRAPVGPPRRDVPQPPARPVFR